MGSWGTGLYSNDTASDVRDACQDIFPFLSVEEGNEILFKEFGQNLDSVPMDDQEASFWYILADWQWKHGMLREEIRKKALSLLTNYTGIEQWEESASASDVKKRKKVLDFLRERLMGEQPPLKNPNPNFESRGTNLETFGFSEHCQKAISVGLAIEASLERYTMNKIEQYTMQVFVLLSGIGILICAENILRFCA